MTSLSLNLGKPTTEQLAAWRACSHPAAMVAADIGDSGSENADERGVAWKAINIEPAALAGIRSTIALGVCECGAPVVSLRMADYERWTPEHGPAWTTPWTRLIIDGEGSGA